jgi:hypothetical protein
MKKTIFVMMTVMALAGCDPDGNNGGSGNNNGTSTINSNGFNTFSVSGADLYTVTFSDNDGFIIGEMVTGSTFDGKVKVPSFGITQLPYYELGSVTNGKLNLNLGEVEDQYLVQDNDNDFSGEPKMLPTHYMGILSGDLAKAALGLVTSDNSHPILWYMDRDTTLNNDASATLVKGWNFMIEEYDGEKITATVTTSPPPGSKWVVSLLAEEEEEDI